MTQIINLLIFIKELVFGRSKKGDRVKTKSSIVHYLVVGLVAISLYGNYVMVKEIFDKTKEIIALKNEVRNLRPLAAKAAELTAVNEVLSSTIEMLTTEERERDRKRRKPLPDVPPSSPAMPLSRPPDVMEIDKESKIK